MKRLLLYFILLCALLCACEKNESPGNESSGRKVEMFYVETVEAFGGQIKEPGNSLPFDDIDTQADSYLFRNISYRCYDANMLFRNHYHTASCWYVDLDGFQAIAQTKDGQYICSMTGDADLNLLLVCQAGENKEVACYVRADSSILDVKDCKFEDFDVKLDGVEVDDTSRISPIWNSHTGEGGSTYSMTIYEDPKDAPKEETHLVELTSKEHPMLTYQLRYTVILDKEMENNVILNNIHEEFPIAIQYPPEWKE